MNKYIFSFVTLCSISQLSVAMNTPPSRGQGQVLVSLQNLSISQEQPTTTRAQSPQQTTQRDLPPSLKEEREKAMSARRAARSSHVYRTNARRTLVYPKP